MTIVQSVLLGILQGIAEFLPISSSGHLAVAQSLFGLDAVPLLYDVMLHLATLLAVFIYFRRKIFRLFKILFIWIFRKPYLDDSDPDDFLSGSEERGKRTIVAVILTSLVTALPFTIEFLRKEVCEMEKYIAPEMEVVEFDNEDVITTSGGDVDEGDV